MGMDQYIIAKHHVTGETFPMMYWRKNYTLNRLICDLMDLDASPSFVETEITQTLIDRIVELPKENFTWFFEYLDGHRNRNGDYDENHNYTPDYQYFYQADW